MFYEVHNSHGAPQCGCDVERFAEWVDMEDYIDDNGVWYDLEDGYATIVERDEPCYLVENDNWPYYDVVLPDELPKMYENAILFGYGSESTFENWLDDMQNQRIITYHD